MKLERRAKIIELIGRYEIETQEELAERLQQAGYSVTQATISRDIRELKLTKVSVGDGPRQKYTLLQEEANLYQKYVRVLQDDFFGTGRKPAGDQNDFRYGDGCCGGDRQIGDFRCGRDDRRG